MRFDQISGRRYRTIPSLEVVPQIYITNSYHYYFFTNPPHLSHKDSEKTATTLKMIKLAAVRAVTAVSVAPTASWVLRLLVDLFDWLMK